MCKAAIVFCSLFLAVGIASADIYKYVDENGVICFTDAPYGKKSQHVSSDKKAARTEQPVTAVVFPKDYSQYIRKAASKYDLEPELIRAVIKTESNGNHRAVSRKGAKGLMQLMPSTANDMNVSNPFDPEENIQAGARYLRLLHELFKGNLELVLAAYNAGPQRVVQNNMTIPPISETISYVKRVKNYYSRLKDSP